MSLFVLAASVQYMADTFISGSRAFWSWLLYMTCCSTEGFWVLVSMGGVTTSDKEISILASSFHSAGISERIRWWNAHSREGANKDKYLHSTFSFTASCFLHDLVLLLFVLFKRSIGKCASFVKQQTCLYKVKQEPLIIQSVKIILLQLHSSLERNSKDGNSSNKETMKCFYFCQMPQTWDTHPWQKSSTATIRKILMSVWQLTVCQHQQQPEGHQHHCPGKLTTRAVGKSFR